MPKSDNNNNNNIRVLPRNPEASAHMMALRSARDNGDNSSHSVNVVMEEALQYAHKAIIGLPRVKRIYLYVNLTMLYANKAIIGLPRVKRIYLYFNLTMLYAHKAIIGSPRVKRVYLYLVNLTTLLNE